MILKNSIILLLLTLFISNTLNANTAKKRGIYATKNFIGQDYYLKRCSSCHGEGNRGGNMASIREWEEIFSHNASELSDLHIDDESMGVVEYIKSKEFKNESNKMLEFLQEFAYDSENIPTCN